MIGDPSVMSDENRRKLEQVRLATVKGNGD